MRRPKVDAPMHSGYAGKSLIERIREDIDETYINWFEAEVKKGTRYAIDFGILQGMCRALGILRSTSESEELQLAEERYEE